MTKYKVLKYFNWGGKLEIEPGQIILVEDMADGRTSQVTIEHYPEKSLLVATRAVQGMLSLEKFELYPY